MTEQRPRGGGWVLPEEPRGRPQVPRSLQLAAVLLLGLGGMLALFGMVWLGVTAALRVDPEYQGQVDLDALGALATVGLLAMFVGIAQVVAGIGVLRLRRSSRLFGIVGALAGQERRNDLRVDRGAAVADSPDRVNEIGDLADAVFEQIAGSLRRV